MRAFFITLTTTPQKQKSNERYQPSGDEHKYIEGIKGVGGGGGVGSLFMSKFFTRHLSHPLIKKVLRTESQSSGITIRILFDDRSFFPLLLSLECRWGDLKERFNKQWPKVYSANILHIISARVIRIVNFKSYI